MQVTGVACWRRVSSLTYLWNCYLALLTVMSFKAPWTLDGCVLPAAWPTTGTIQFQDYGLQYRKGLEWALKNISVSIQNREKVSIETETCYAFMNGSNNNTKYRLMNNSKMRL